MKNGGAARNHERAENRVLANATEHCKVQERFTRTGVRDQAFFTRRFFQSRHRCEECQTGLPTALDIESRPMALQRAGEGKQWAGTAIL